MPVDRSDKSRLTEGEAALATFRYGNWTGGSFGGKLYWTAGEFFTTDVIKNVAPTDSFDALSKWHDIAYDNAQLRQAVDITLGVDPILAKTWSSVSILHSDRVYLAQLPFHHIKNSHRTTAYRQLAYGAFQLKSIGHRDEVRDFLNSIKGKLEGKPKRFRDMAERIRTLFREMSRYDLKDRQPEYEAQPFLNTKFYKAMLKQIADPSEGPVVGADGKLKTMTKKRLREVIEETGGLDPTGSPEKHEMNKFVRQHRKSEVWVDDLSDDAQSLYLGAAEVAWRRMYDTDR